MSLEESKKKWNFMPMSMSVPKYEKHSKPLPRFVGITSPNPANAIAKEKL